ncbi:MAG: Asp-tRNA(Asn)/Glu-tRNA(Gln) amidotransferase subunit GatB [Planctomycetota bacterium]|nr:Asp-tRNA(Asn)/Glu-tRNA(Gln) amidotransferase subunit GatB [Planctomycetota bacterium]
MEFTPIIGLEVHVQLLTKSKLFCGCANLFNPDNPNVQTCPVCLGLPGSLPVMNQEALRLSQKTAMALNLNLAKFTKWDRKQYYYPDLPKAYQISQFDLPFSYDGWVEVTLPSSGETTKVRLIRAHLEEDAGKNMHDESGRGGDSKVDLNRTGTPLLEIVSEPDIRCAEEARVFLEELRLLLRYIEVSDCNMQEGSMRCDANVNLHVHEDGEKIPTPIVEIKNLNSFRGVEAAIEYEIKRQVKAWETERKRIGDVPKETRGWGADRGQTFAQRGKEDAADYRYFPDPDLVPVTTTDEQLDAIRATLCVFPADRRRRYVNDLGLSAYDASVIVDQGRDFADYFDEVASACGDGKQAANWVTQDVQRELNDRKVEITDFAIPAAVLGNVLERIVNGDITVKSGREVFTELLALTDDGVEVSAGSVETIIADKGLVVVKDTGKIDAAIQAVIDNERNAKAVEDVRNGKQQAVGPLIGQVMRELKGADAGSVRQMIIDKLTS